VDGVGVGVSPLYPSSRDSKGWDRGAPGIRCISARTLSFASMGEATAQSQKKHYFSSLLPIKRRREEKWLAGGEHMFVPGSHQCGRLPLGPGVPNWE
jgi:hypothetical protein